jgi:hypothetical protein
MSTATLKRELALLRSSLAALKPSQSATLDDPIAWAELTAGLTLNPWQRNVLLSGAPRLLLNATRQSYGNDGLLGTRGDADRRPWRRRPLRCTGIDFGVAQNTQLASERRPTCVPPSTTNTTIGSLGPGPSRSTGGENDGWPRWASPACAGTPRPNSRPS